MSYKQMPRGGESFVLKSFSSFVERLAFGVVSWLLAWGILLFGLWPVTSRAADGSWTNNASSLWSAATYGSSDTLANGADFTANPKTANLAAGRTKILDSSSAIPEASPFLLMGLGLLILSCTWRRHKA